MKILGRYRRRARSGGPGHGQWSHARTVGASGADRFQSGHPLISGILAFVLLLSAMVPPGFMLGRNADGALDLVICSGTGTVPSGLSSEARKALIDLARAAGQDTPPTDDSQALSGPCAMALVKAAYALPVAPVQVVVRYAPPLRADAVAFVAAPRTVSVRHAPPRGPPSGTRTPLIFA